MPINVRAINDVRLHSYDKPPTRLNFQVTVAWDSSWTLTDHLKKLKRISPEEPVHALLWGIDYAHKRGMKTGELAVWEALLLSVTFVFE